MTRLDILGRVYNGQGESMRWIQLSPCPWSLIHLPYSLDGLSPKFFFNTMGHFD